MSGDAYVQRGTFASLGKVTAATSLSASFTVHEMDQILLVGLSITGASLSSCRFDGVDGGDIGNESADDPKLHLRIFGEFEPLHKGTHTIAIQSSASATITAIALSLRNCYGYSWTTSSQSTIAAGTINVPMELSFRDGYVVGLWQDVGSGMTAVENTTLVGTGETGTGPLAFFDSQGFSIQPTNLGITTWSPHKVTTSGSTKVLASGFRPWASLNVMMMEHERGAALL